MKAILFLSPLLLTVVTCSTWVCIFTSTEDMFNGAYRHQADTYRAVQLLIYSGFPKDHIFYMSPDNAAYSLDNPTLGYLFTEPGCDARDVTYNVTVNYSGSQVNKTNFKRFIGFRNITNGNILDINISENDTIIYYIVGHGDTGTIYMKDSYIYYDDIIEGMEKLLFSHHYLHIYFFIDTCKAGSLFSHDSFSQFVYLQRFNQSFEHDINVISATNATHNSFGMYCGIHSILNTLVCDKCLTDVFSKRWMDFIQFGMGNETMREMFNEVKASVTESPVTAYGRWEEAAWNRTISDVFNIGEYNPFINILDPIYSSCLNGSTSSPIQDYTSSPPLFGSRRLKDTSLNRQIAFDINRKRQVALQTYINSHPEWKNMNVKRELTRLKNLELRSKAFTGSDKQQFIKLYNKEKKMIQDIDAWEISFKKKYANITFGPTDVREWDCFHKIVEKFDKKFGHSVYGMSRFYYLATLCNHDKNSYKDF